MTVSLFEKFMKMFAKSGINKNTSSREAEITNERGTVDSKTISINEAPYLNLINQLSSAKPEVAAAALYYLEKIAENEKYEYDDICRELEKFVAAAKKKTATILEVAATLHKLRK